MFRANERPGSSTRDFLDLMAVDDYEGDLLTWADLADLVGITPKEDGSLPGVEMYNACMSIQSNPKYQSLPDDKRHQALASAAAAMDEIWSS